MRDIRKIIQEEIENYIKSFVTDSDLKELERELDSLFSDVGIDINFTRHFLDRVNDERNGKDITIDELRSIFKRVYAKYKKDLLNLDNGFEGVIKSYKSNINVPFRLQWDRKNKELDLINKTVMRKKNFKTSNPILPVRESVDSFFKEGEGFLKKLEKTEQKNWGGGDVYKMDVNDDKFIHFTSFSNVDKILSSGRLNSGGNDFSSFAISTTYGVNSPKVQNTKLKEPQAIIFTTTEAPNGDNFAEEVTWKGGVGLKDAKHISFEEAVSMLNKTPERLPSPDDDSVIYYNSLEESEGDYLKVYHGTMNKKLPSIKSRGLESSMGYHNPEWYMVSTDFESALFHANGNEEEETIPVIEYKIPIKDGRWYGDPYFWPSYDRGVSSKWFSLKEVIPSEYIVKVHEIPYNNFIEQKRKGF